MYLSLPRVVKNFQDDRDNNNFKFFIISIDIMNAYERVIKTLNNEEPDRVPLFNQVITSGIKKNVSELLPYGSTDQVVEAVKTCIRDAGNGGGYILSPCTDLTNSCKVENVLTMIQTAQKYGKYPLRV